MKYDTGKLMFTCLTRGLALALRSVAAVLTYGALKYKPDSWKTVPDAKRRYEDALDRHLNAWKAGEHADGESGMSHLSHAACNVLFLLELEASTRGVDKSAYFSFTDPTKTVAQPAPAYRSELENDED